MSDAAQTFIRVAEVWTPTDDGALLELAGGIFDDATGYEAMSRMICFSAHEGLPGHVWADGHPMLLRQFEGSPFRRTVALHAAGLRCAVTMPIVRDGRITSIVQLLLADPQPHEASAELWRHDETSQRRDAFPEEAALTETRATNRPTLQVSTGPSAVAGIQTLSLPFPADGRLAWSLRFTAPPGLPLARRTEIWWRAAAASRAMNCCQACNQCQVGELSSEARA